MGAVIKSKFKSSFWIEGIFISLLLIGFLSYSGIFLVKRWQLYNKPTLLLLAALSLLLLYLYVKTAVNVLKQVVITPDELIIKSLVTGRQFSFKYENITGVSNHKVSDIMPSWFSREQQQLLIELNDNVEVSFTDEQFANYEELKEAIKNYRFNLE